MARNGRPGKLTAGGGDTGRPPAAWTSAVDGGRLVESLPIFGGPGSKTRGVFVGPDLREQPLVSEENPQTKALAARVGLARSWAAETHVESHAAQAMHRLGLMDAILAVNQKPCRGMQGCDTHLSRLLPPGARLTVYGPDGFTKTYVGREEGPR